MIRLRPQAALALLLAAAVLQGCMAAQVAGAAAGATVDVAGAAVKTGVKTAGAAADAVVP